MGSPAGKRLNAKDNIVGLPEHARGKGIPFETLLSRERTGRQQFPLNQQTVVRGGVRVLNEDIVVGLGINAQVVAAVTAQAQGEIERREATYRDGGAPAPLAGKIAILADDGIATGATMRAAIVALRAHKPAKIVVAVGVAPPEVCSALAQQVDQVLCLLQPEPFLAVGLWFANFGATSDEEVRALLAAAKRWMPADG